LAAEVKPGHGTGNGLQIFCVFLLARFAGNPLIRAKSHDFLTKTTTQQPQKEGHQSYG
jgi:hypothetical protein